jgi:hypothetical protein
MEDFNYHAFLTQELIKNHLKNMDDTFIEYLRAAGIKGEITSGKLKWHGITIQRFSGSTRSTSYQLLQRGEPISPIITF